MFKLLSQSWNNFVNRFHVFKDGNEYYVPLSQIKIDSSWGKDPIIGIQKWAKKMEFFLRFGEFESKIVIRRNDWVLIDGYSSYKIAKLVGLRDVPVYFVD